MKLCAFAAKDGSSYKSSYVHVLLCSLFIIIIIVVIIVIILILFHSF